MARCMAAKGVFDVPEKFYENLYISSLLHDIGKIAIPEAILTKQGALTHDEFEIMKTHARRGADILSSLTDFEGCIAGVRHHHERFDGTGYPDGLKGDEIPMISAIISVADTFDAMTTDRPYRKGFPKECAIEEIKNYLGKWYHPLPAAAIIELYENGEI
jgi:HD-GYP domain-containing protein (c-di-GMP phosphodiesterase class II)